MYIIVFRFATLYSATSETAFDSYEWNYHVKICESLSVPQDCLKEK